MMAGTASTRQASRRRRGLLVGLGLLVAGVGGAGLATTRAAPSVELAWHIGDGTAFRIAVPRPALDRFAVAHRDAMARGVATAQARLAAAAEAETEAVARAMLAALPDFTDWLYGWVESYVTSYLIALRALQSEGESWQRGAAAAPVATVEEVMHSVIGERFVRMVVARAAPEAAHAAATVRLAALVDAEIAHLAAAERTAWDRFLRDEGTVRGRGPATGDPGCVASARPEAAASQLAGVRAAQGNLIAMRFLRPYLARLALLGLRVGLGEALGLAGGGLGVGALATSGGLIALAGTTATVWGVDWMINQGDAALHRAEMEMALAASIEQAYRADAIALTTLHQARIAGRLGCLAATGGRK